MACPRPLAELYPLPFAVFLLVRILPKEMCLHLVERFAEIGAVVGLEGLMSAFDHCQVNSNGIVTSNSDGINVFESNGTLYDTRDTNIFGGGHSMCPGRVYIKTFLFSQQRYKDQFPS